VFTSLARLEKSNLLLNIPITLSQVTSSSVDEHVVGSVRMINHSVNMLFMSHVLAHLTSLEIKTNKMVICKD